MVTAMTDAEHWASVLNVQLRPEHQQARQIAHAMRERGITARSFTAYAIVIIGVNTWRERLNELDDSFVEQVDAIYAVTENWDIAYRWAVIGIPESLSLEFIMTFIDIVPDSNTVIEMMVGKKYSASFIMSILSNDIDMNLIKKMMAV